MRVDGSCTVPPLQVLKRTRNNTGVLFENVPEKADLWQKKTEGLRGEKRMHVLLKPQKSMLCSLSNLAMAKIKPSN